MFVLDRRFTNRWQGRVSYVYSKSEGYLRNNGAPTYGQEAFFETPTLSLVNSFGYTEQRPAARAQGARHLASSRRSRSTSAATTAS